MPRYAFRLASSIQPWIIAAVAIGCADHYPGAAPSVGANWNHASAEAAAVLASVRDMFLFDDSDGESTAPAKRSAVGPLGTGKLAVSSDGSRLVSSIELGSISVGRRSSDATTISAREMTARVTLAGATGAFAENADGYAVYRGGYGNGVDVIVRAHDQGVEDYLVFAARPASARVAYSLDLQNVSGLRLVASTLELLDEHGVPRLRMAAPYVIDSGGHVEFASVSVTGCAVDTNAAPPWTRRVLPVAALGCGVQIDWRSDKLQYPVILDPSWGTTESMVAERDHHTISLVPGPGVLAVGGVWGGQPLTTTEVFSPVWSAWTTVGNTHLARYRHTATVLPDGRVLVVGGSFSYSPTPLQANSEIYDPVTGTFAPPTTMHYARSGHTASLLGDGRVLVAGGADEIAGGESKTTELWDPSTQAWTDGPPMIDGRADHTATVLMDGKRVLVVGGYLPSPFVPLSSSELFDESSNTWSPTLRNPATANSPLVGPQLSTLTVPRAKHATALMWDGSVLVVGGEFGSGLASDIADGAELYVDNPSANGLTTVNGWTPGPDCTAVGTFPGICHRFDMGQAVNANGAAYFIGGDAGGLTAVANVVQYPVATNSGATFAQRSRLPVAIVRPRSSLMPDGRIFVAGGRVGPVRPQPSAQAYALYGVVDTNSNAPELTTDRTSYVIGEPMQALFWLTPTGANDYISVFDATSGNEIVRLQTSGSASGSLRFDLAQTGSYRLRAYHVSDPSMPGQLIIETNSPFTVGTLTPATVSTDKSSYANSDTITVSFSGMTGTLDEVIGIAAAGGTNAPIQLRYTVGATSGSLTFANLPPGSYIANAYVFDQPTVRGQSATFTVN